MERISNAWRLSKSSWAVLNKDRELIAIPVVAGIAAFIAFVALVVPPALALGAFDETSSTNPALYLFTFLGAVAAAWMSAIGQAAVVAGAAQRMDGHDPTIGTAFAVARSRAVRLLEWAVLATVVAVVLDAIEQRLGIIGKLVSWIGSVAFAVMSFMALPVIVFEDVGAIEAFKRSSVMLKATWGEQISFNFGMGLISMIAIIPGVLVGGALAGTGVAPLVVLGVGIIVAWVVLTVAVTSSLSAVFKAALYRWAKDLPVDPAFAPSDFRTAFRPKE